MRSVNVLLTSKLHFLVTSHRVQRSQCESGKKTEIAPVSSLLVLDINHWSKWNKCIKNLHYMANPGFSFLKLFLQVCTSPLSPGNLHKGEGIIAQNNIKRGLTLWSDIILNGKSHASKVDVNISQSWIWLLSSGETFLMLRTWDMQFCCFLSWLLYANEGKNHQK